MYEYDPKSGIRPADLLRSFVQLPLGALSPVLPVDVLCSAATADAGWFDVLLVFQRAFEYHRSPYFLHLQLHSRSSHLPLRSRVLFSHSDL
jgi:hypothetical protein